MLEKVMGAILSSCIGMGGISMALLIIAVLTIPSSGFWNGVTIGALPIIVPLVLLMIVGAIVAFFGGLHYIKLTLSLLK